MFVIKRSHPGLFLLVPVWLLLCAGCASLKPSAASIPPDDKGGLAVSDESRSAIGIFGTCAYYLGEFFAGGRLP